MSNLRDQQEEWSFQLIRFNPIGRDALLLLREDGQHIVSN